MFFRYIPPALGRFGEALASSFAPLRIVLLSVLALLGLSLYAETQSDIDKEWASLTKPISTSESLAAGAQGKSSGSGDLVIAAFIAKAADFKAFYSKYPSSTYAAEARCQEAVSLLEAQRRGSTSDKARCEVLVANIRNDESFTDLQRYQVASLADHINLVPYKTPQVERFKLLEKTERSLIKEFPKVPNGYESLLRLSEIADDTTALSIAAEIKDQSLASPKIRHEAKELVARSRLLGMSLPKKVISIVGNFAGLASYKEGTSILVYTWSVKNARSILLAKSLAASAERGSLIIGINIDGESKDLRETAKKLGLPGFLYFDQMGPAGAFASALHMTSTPLAYKTDAKGIITNIKAHSQTTQSVKKN